MTPTRSSRLTRVAAARTAVVLVGATGALGAALAIGVNTANDEDATAWIAGTGDDTGQDQAPEEEWDDGDGRRLPAGAPSHVSTAQPGPQHAQSNGS